MLDSMQVNYFRKHSASVNDSKSETMSLLCELVLPEKIRQKFVFSNETDE